MDDYIDLSVLGTGAPNQEFPGLDVCLRGLFHHDALVMEDAYGWLLAVAAEHAERLVAELEGSSGVGRLFLIELIGASGSTAGFTALKSLMWSSNRQDSEVAQESLWASFGEAGWVEVWRYQDMAGPFADYLKGEDSTETGDD